MRPPHVLVGGRPQTLARRIGKGGEGDVYAIAGDPAHAIKLYTTPDRLSREDKVAAMVRSNLAGRSSLAAFPVAVVHLGDGSFGGFVMKLMDGYLPLHELYAPGPRKHHFPQADYRFLARAATNIVKAFASVHLTNCVVGDINHSGILISSKATAALIDADSFQFVHGSTRHGCRVGVPEYTPPELQGQPLDRVVRTIDHDAFGLAVIIFQVLLMGRHPFVGTPRRGDTPPLHESIQQFRYVYAEGRDVGMSRPPGTPVLSDFSPELAKLFDRTFSQSCVGRRPATQEWIAALEQFESSLVRCSTNALHHISRESKKCAWCEMELRLGSFLFLPYLTPGGLSASAASNSTPFSVELVWARIERVRTLSEEELQPRLPQLSLGPSAQAKEAAARPRWGTSRWLGVLLLASAVAVIVYQPQILALGIYMILGALGLLTINRNSKAVAAPFRRELESAKAHWYRTVEDWYGRMGLQGCKDLRDQLKLAKLRYEELVEEERRLSADYGSKRKDRQLQAYLEGFDVAAAGIKGIGQGRITTLASYGIDTAGDVISARLQGVPGFGEALTGRLLSWRAKLEAGFVYNASENAADKQELARIRALTEGRAAPLRTTLSNGAQELEGRVRRMLEFAKQEDPALLLAHRRLEQARQDLIVLGVQTPGLHRSSFGPAASSTPVITGSSPALPSTTAPGARAMTQPCPVCGNSMTKRLARRGPGAGHYFWGCTHYPTCRGTRPI